MTDHFVDTTKMVSLNPLPELVYRLRDEAPYGNLDGGTKRELHLIDAAYRAGADQELEACVEWLGDAPVVYNNNGDLHPGSYLRDARRPKPPSLKAQALAALEALPTPAGQVTADRLDTIRRALEVLDD